MRSTTFPRIQIRHCCLPVTKKKKNERKQAHDLLNILITKYFLFLGLGKFHVLLLLACGLCLMATIVETLNIGFVIPLIDMECELNLTLYQKGLLNSAAFVGL